MKVTFDDAVWEFFTEDGKPHMKKIADFVEGGNPYEAEGIVHPLKALPFPIVGKDLIVYFEDWDLPSKFGVVRRIVR